MALGPILSTLIASLCFAAEPGSLGSQQQPPPKVNANDIPFVRELLTKSRLSLSPLERVNVEVKGGMQGTTFQPRMRARINSVLNPELELNSGFSLAAKDFTQLNARASGSLESRDKKYRLVPEIGMTERGTGAERFTSQSMGLGLSMALRDGWTITPSFSRRNEQLALESRMTDSLGIQSRLPVSKIGTFDLSLRQDRPYGRDFNNAVQGTFSMSFGRKGSDASSKKKTQTAKNSPFPNPIN